MNHLLLRHHLMTREFFFFLHDLFLTYILMHFTGFVNSLFFSSFRFRQCRRKSSSESALHRQVRFNNEIKITPILDQDENFTFYQVTLFFNFHHKIHTSYRAVNYFRKRVRDFFDFFCDFWFFFLWFFGLSCDFLIFWFFFFIFF